MPANRKIISLPWPFALRGFADDLRHRIASVPAQSHAEHPVNSMHVGFVFRLVEVSCRHWYAASTIIHL
jgi:hypothetical protein